MLWLNEGLGVGGHPRGCLASTPVSCWNICGAALSCKERKKVAHEPTRASQTSPVSLVLSYWMQGLLSASHTGSTLTGGASFLESTVFEVFLKRYQMAEVSQSFGGKPEGGNA